MRLELEVKDKMDLDQFPVVILIKNKKKGMGLRRGIPRKRWKYTEEKGKVEVREGWEILTGKIQRILQKEQGNRV